MSKDPYQIFKFKVVMNDYLDHYKEEDLVKQVWPSMYGFLTKRNGLNKGKMELEDGAVVIHWSYSYVDKEEDWWEGHCPTCHAPYLTEKITQEADNT